MPGNNRGTDSENIRPVSLDPTLPSRVIKRYALLIGVGSVEDERFQSFNHEGITQNIKGLSEIFSNSLNGHFEVTTLLDPSYMETRMAIREIFQKAEHDDVVLVYYSGFGIYRNESLRLVCRDYIRDQDFASLGYEEIVFLSFAASKCENFVLIVDVPASGAFVNRVSALPEGMAAITGGGDSHEQTDYGFITRIILNGFKSGYIDSNRDGKITISNLFDYIVDQIEANYPNYHPPKKWWNMDKDICLFDLEKPVFISYQRKQKDLIEKISTALQEHHISTFVDQEQIRIGDNWKDLIENNIRNCRAFLFMMDKEILFSEIANWELEIAHQNKVAILPIVVEKMRINVLFEKTYGSVQQIDI